MPHEPVDESGTRVPSSNDKHLGCIGAIADSESSVGRLNTGAISFKRSGLAEDFVLWRCVGHLLMSPASAPSWA
jgi:hypothetical protein